MSVYLYEVTVLKFSISVPRLQLDAPTISKAEKWKTVVAGFSHRLDGFVQIHSCIEGFAIQGNVGNPWQCLVAFRHERRKDPFKGRQSLCTTREVVKIKYSERPGLRGCMTHSHDKGKGYDSVAHNSQEPVITTIHTQRISS